MSLASRNRSVLLSASGVAWREREDPGALRWLAADSGGRFPSLDAAIDSVEKSIWNEGARAGVAKEKLRVLISDDWLEWLVLPWCTEPVGSVAVTRRFREWRNAMLPTVGSSDEAVFGEAMTSFGTPRIAAALPARCIASLRQLAARLGMHLAAVTPLSIATWEAIKGEIREREYVCAVVYQRTAVLLVVMNGKLFAVCRGAEAVGAESLWRRMRMREPKLNRPLPRYLVHLDGESDSDEDWRRLSHATSAALVKTLSRQQGSAVEFVEPPSTVRGWKAAVVVFCVAVSAVAVTYALDKAERVNGLHSARPDRVAASRAAAQRRMIPADERTAVLRVEQVNRAISELNTPVPDLLRAVNPPSGLRVALLELQFRGDEGSAVAGSMEVTAEARTADEMARYVSHLSKTAPLWSAYLSKHEVVQSGEQERLRFNVDVKWRSP